MKTFFQILLLCSIVTLALSAQNCMFYVDMNCATCSAANVSYCGTCKSGYIFNSETPASCVPSTPDGWQFFQNKHLNSSLPAAIATSPNRFSPLPPNSNSYSAANCSSCFYPNVSPIPLPYIHGTQQWCKAQCLADANCNGFQMVRTSNWCWLFHWNDITYSPTQLNSGTCSLPFDYGHDTWVINRNGCYQACQTCSGHDNGQCQTCKTGFVFSNGFCNCPAGKYFDQFASSPTFGQCVNCAGYAQSNCNSCDPINDLACKNLCGCNQCQKFTCPDFYNIINPTSTVLTQDNCCQATCATFTCPAGYSTNSGTLVPANQATCCTLIPTCGNSFTCPAGYSAINSGSTTVNQATCCQELCGATSFSCNAGTALDITKLTFAASQETCCLPTCLNYVCPEGYSPNFDNEGSFPASTDLCCTQIVQAVSCLSVLGSCNGFDIMVDPTADYISYSQCCQPPTCPQDTYFNNGACIPCQWDIIDPPNDATYNWCRCNCYTPGTTILNSGVCWLQGFGEQIFPKECKWVCPGNELTSTNGTQTINQWVDTCVLTPQCNSNCYTCSKTNSLQCTSCFYGQTLIDGKCVCPNGKFSVYAVCPP